MIREIPCHDSDLSSQLLIFNIQFKLVIDKSVLLFFLKKRKEYFVYTKVFILNLEELLNYLEVSFKKFKTNFILPMNRQKSD